MTFVYLKIHKYWRNKIPAIYEELPNTDRELLLNVWVWQNISSTEIANQKNVTISAISCRLKKIVKKLAIKLNDKGYDVKVSSGLRERNSDSVKKNYGY